MAIANSGNAGAAHPSRAGGCHGTGHRATVTVGHWQPSCTIGHHHRSRRGVAHRAIRRQRGRPGLSFALRSDRGHERRPIAQPTLSREQSPTVTSSNCRALPCPARPQRRAARRPGRLHQFSRSSHVELPQGSLAARLRAHDLGHDMVTGDHPQRHPDAERAGPRTSLTTLMCSQDGPRPSSPTLPGTARIGGRHSVVGGFPEAPPRG